MNSRNLVVGAALAGSLIAAGSASATILVGDTVQINYLYPDTNSVYQSNTTTYTGPGTTLPIIYTGTATFFDNLITLVQNNNWSYNSAAFNGVQLTDLSNASAFAGWSVLPSTTMTGFSEYASGGSLFVNWQGVTTFTGAEVDLGSSVPEPAAWAMILVGFGGLGAVMRTHRRGNRDLAALKA